MIKIISGSNGITRMFQDGKEITGIKSISFTHDAMKDSPELKVIFARDNLEIDSLVIPALPEFYKGLYIKNPEIKAYEDISQ